MADEAKNGIPDVDKSPESTENEENKVQSPIVMRIDAPDSAPSVDPEPPAFSFSGARDFSYRSLPRRAFPSACSPNRVFSSSNSTRPFAGLSGGRGIGLPSRPSPFGGGLFGQSVMAAPASPRQPLLRPSSLAVNSDVSSTEPDDGVAASAAVSSESRSEDCDGAASSTIATATTTTAPPVKFMPLGGAAPSHKDDSGAVSGAGGVSSSITGFVFGQNLRARAVASDAPDSTSATEPVATSNGTAATEMLFTSVIQSEPPAADSSGGAGGGSATGGGATAGSGASGGAEGKSLSEAAAEYEESRAVKRTYQHVALFTGEEDEDNVQQVNCRLFAYDGATGQYVERGRGTLRLNDRKGPDGTQSRVVMRTAGSLRVVLNTKVWGGMLVDRASPKSVRITAMEAPGQIKVFLVMANPTEIEGLYRALQTRVARRQVTNGEPADGEPADSDPADSEPADGEPALAKRGRASESPNQGDL